MAIRITQTGVALTVGIIVVTGLIIGGLFFVKQSGEQARHQEAVKIAEQNLRAQSDKGVALNEDPHKSANSSQDTPKTPESNGAISTPRAGAGTGELPHTGPADQLVRYIATGLLTFTVVSYIASRRELYGRQL